jgi:hypothetical protein
LTNLQIRGIIFTKEEDVRGERTERERRDGKGKRGEKSVMLV